MLIYVIIFIILFYLLTITTLMWLGTIAKCPPKVKKLSIFQDLSTVTGTNKWVSVTFPVPVLWRKIIV